MTPFATARSIVVAMLGCLAGLCLAALAMPVAARAADPVIPTPEPGKTVSIIVYGDDPCPAGKSDEIVVCARQPESERYRIPKRFRGKKAAASPASNSWGNKVQSSEDASRMAAGLPDTCSAVGTGGQSGCYQQFMNQAYQQRRQQKADEADSTSPQ
jgi:hypothetical protein